MLADLVKRAGRRIGVDIGRYRPYGARRQRLLAETRVETVIDVGANAGQYGRELRVAGYQGLIISFEPLAEAFDELVRSADRDSRWECLNVAVGDVEGEAELHVASNRASSSLLALAPAHRLGAPTVAHVATQRVHVRPLDGLGLEIAAPALLKLDVQGYEERVLSGAERLLEQVAVIECELSLAPLYERQAGFARMIGVLDELGYALVDLDPFFYDLRDGRVLSLDGLFVRGGTA